MTEQPWPQWTEEITERTVPGEDQLGVEGAAQGYQQSILPGIITVTEHARYYSFYAWVLYRFIYSENTSNLMRDYRGKYFRRHEVALIIATFTHHQDDPNFSGVVGSGRNFDKPRGYWDAGQNIQLDQNYFQNLLGGFGQYYRTAMTLMGIIEEPEKPGWVYQLTERGKELAEQYQASIQDTKYANKLVTSDSLETITRDEAVEYGVVGCLCNKALNIGQDRELLLDTFFRFDIPADINNTHYCRRNSLGVALDLVHQANGKFSRDMLRPALYLGEYNSELIYNPAKKIDDWCKRWQMVEVRHLYTFGLQCIWASFLLQLDLHRYFSRQDWNDWVHSKLREEDWDITFKDLAVLLCSPIGLESNYEMLFNMVPKSFGLSSESDEYSLYLHARSTNNDSSILLKSGIAILIQLFLRFNNNHMQNDNIWLEMATRERLPLTRYFDNVNQNTKENNFSVQQWLSWIFQEYIFEQHEYIALGKIRAQNYDTFKFYYENGVFHWPTGKEPYREPIRLAGNRLNNCLTMLIDLGLIKENHTLCLELTEDGFQYYNQVLERLDEPN